MQDTFVGPDVQNRALDRLQDILDLALRQLDGGTGKQSLVSAHSKPVLFFLKGSAGLSEFVPRSCRFLQKVWSPQALRRDG